MLSVRFAEQGASVTAVDVAENQIAAARERAAAGEFCLSTYHRYVEDLTLTPEAWRGRIRACRGVGASLDQEAVRRFDSEHAELPASVAGPTLSIPHLIAIQIFEPTVA